VQHGNEQRAYRPCEVDQVPRDRIVQDRLGHPDITVDRCHPVVRRKQGPSVSADHRVVIDVEHAGIRQDFPGNLMDIRPGRYPGAEVDELIDPTTRHELDSAHQKLTVGACDLPAKRHHRQR
jgi:hypothetical protein